MSVYIGLYYGDTRNINHQSCAGPGSEGGGRGALKPLSDESLGGWEGSSGVLSCPIGRKKQFVNWKSRSVVRPEL